MIFAVIIDIEIVTGNTSEYFSDFAISVPFCVIQHCETFRMNHTAAPTRLKKRTAVFFGRSSRHQCHHPLQVHNYLTSSDAAKYIAYKLHKRCPYQGSTSKTLVFSFLRTTKLWYIQLASKQKVVTEGAGSTGTGTPYHRDWQTKGKHKMVRRQILH